MDIFDPLFATKSPGAAASHPTRAVDIYVVPLPKLSMHTNTSYKPPLPAGAKIVVAVLLGALTEPLAERIPGPVISTVPAAVFCWYCVVPAFVTTLSSTCI